MNRIKLVIALLVFVSYSHAQVKEANAEKKAWDREQKLLEYRKSRDYRGPDNMYSSPSPASMIREDNWMTIPENSKESSGMHYDPDRIVKDRARQQGTSKGSGGKKGVDPEVKKPEPIDLPEFNPPDAPDVDLPNLDIENSGFSPFFWKFLLILILFLVIVFVLYYWFKNKGYKNARVNTEIDEQWNPGALSKSELESRLQDAMGLENYRECVRIWFTFILKELIRKNWINWKKDKTNHHYQIEVAGKPNAEIFNECVRIYDLVWYGEYAINKEIYLTLEKVLLNYYQSLKPENE